MTVIDHLHPIINGTVLLPGHIVRGTIAGNGFRLLVTDICGDDITGIELVTHHRAHVFDKVTRAGGRTLVTEKGRTYVRRNVRTVHATDITTITKERAL